MMPPLPNVIDFPRREGEGWQEHLQRYALAYGRAVAEACAKVCDTHTVDDVLVGVGIAQSCAAAIREAAKEGR